MRVGYYPRPMKVSQDHLHHPHLLPSHLRRPWPIFCRPSGLFARGICRDETRTTWTERKTRLQKSATQPDVELTSGWISDCKTHLPPPASPFRRVRVSPRANLNQARHGASRDVSPLTQAIDNGLEIVGRKAGPRFGSLPPCGGG